MQWLPFAYPIFNHNFVLNASPDDVENFRIPFLDFPSRNCYTEYNYVTKIAEDAMSELKNCFMNEALQRFHLEKLAEKDKDEVLKEIGSRYVDTFLNDEDVCEKYQEDALTEQAVLHCYHAGIIIALYEVSEEDYQISEKTFAVLTNMDTLFFSSIMYSRWQPKKRYAKYKTDFMAKSLWQLISHIAGEEGMDIRDAAVRNEGLRLLFLAGAAANLETMEDPYCDLSGIEE